MRTIILLALLSEAAAQGCSLCANGVAPQNPNRIIPFLAVSGNPNPTCQIVADFAPSTTNAQVCELIQAHANYCQCPETTGLPVNQCSLCADFASPANGEAETPFGDTCNELAEYASFLPESQCQTERLEILRRNDFFCQCPNADTPCNFCADGSNDISNPDLVIPFLSIDDNSNPTCQDVAIHSSFQDPGVIDCSLLQRQGAYCGCPGELPQNLCSLCPDGAVPANADKILPTGDKCSELSTYISYLDEDGCNSGTGRQIKALGYVCGCPGVEPECTLCPNGDPVSNPTAFAFSPEDGTTCAEFETIASTLTANICDREKERLSYASYRCCANAELPVCSIQQNPALCTASLLAKATEVCECYNFCNDEFDGCSSFPGETISCRGTVVSGCNEAAIGGGGGGGGGGSAAPSQHGGLSSITVLLSFVTLIVAVVI